MGIDVMSVGTLCFGIVVGYITYRTLARKDDAAISDLAAVIAAVGGGAVTSLFDSDSDRFGIYSIGLLIGMAIYLLLSLAIRGKKATSDIMEDTDGVLPG